MSSRLDRMEESIRRMSEVVSNLVPRKEPDKRARAVPRGFSLEEAPVNLPQTIRLGEDSWKQFLTWASKEIVSCEPLEFLWCLPIFLQHSIRRFSDLQFKQGGSLLYDRRLILCAQRRVPGIKMCSSIC